MLQKEIVYGLFIRHIGVLYTRKMKLIFTLKACTAAPLNAHTYLN